MARLSTIPKEEIQLSAFCKAQQTSLLAWISHYCFYAKRQVGKLWILEKSNLMLIFSKSKDSFKKKAFV